MVRLRPERRTALCSLLKNVLRETLEDALAETDRATRATSLDCAIAATGAVKAAVYSVLSGFAQDWNAAQPDRLVALPPELVWAIFRQLDLAGRITVSHVCASWRRVALADRVLWARYSIRDHDADDDDDDATSISTAAQARKWDTDLHTHALSVMLVRSHPLPFRLHAEYVSDTVGEIVIANMGRMEVLSFDNFQSRSTLQSLVAQDAAVLKAFSCYFPSSSSGSLSLSPQWAERLERLDLTGWWRWPVGCVFSAVRTFHGTFPEHQDANWRLVDLFPNLTDLFLPGISSQAHIDHLDPLPPALTSVKLRSARAPLDYAAVLRHCRATGLRVLNISDVRDTASFVEALALFLRTFGGQWAMRLTTTHMVLSSPERTAGLHAPHECMIHSHSANRLLSAPGVSATLGRMCELDVKLSGLLDLWKTLPPGASLALPALNVLRISLAGESVERLHALENGAHVDAPALASMHVDMGDIETSVSAVLALILRAFRTQARVDALVEVHSDVVDPIPWEDLSTLQGLVSQMTVRARYGDSVAVHILSAPAPGEQ